MKRNIVNRIVAGVCLGLTITGTIAGDSPAASGEKPESNRCTAGLWPANDLRRAFVDGARWWEWRSTNGTMWQSDRNVAEEEAERKYPGGQPAPAVKEKQNG